MGQAIEAAATVTSVASPRRRGALRLADAAATRCLRRAGRSPGELDLLINVGNYRDRNLAEPALVALVQEDVHANPGHPPVPGRHGTFSFDVGNGGCGPLTALHLVRGFVESGAVDLGMVVASDSPPRARDRHRFPYQASGGALLVRQVDDDAGFEEFRFATFPEYADLCDGRLVWRPARSRARNGRLPRRAGAHVLEVDLRPGYAERARECAAEVATDLLCSTRTAVPAVDLLVATHGPGFADALAGRLGVDPARVAHVPTELERAHTVEPAAAVDAAMRSGSWDRSATVLFVAAGAGITVGAALYRQRPCWPHA
jgi:3-oxoacyl-[acyl-carrier-protein] synthase III